MLASQGYCVVCIDSRGSRHRGVQFESHLRRRLGTVELADQVEVFRSLSKQLGFIDLNRVAIHGGFMCFLSCSLFILQYLFHRRLVLWRLFKFNGPGTISRLV